MWIKRIYQEKVLAALKSRPVILLTGARQTGKSSLLQRICPNVQYITLDNIRYAELAKDNPEYFLSTFNEAVILDEIQYAPELFRYIKIIVDQNRQSYGQWILTGSQKFELMQSVGDSLAGRIRILHLQTLSAKEIREQGLKNLNDIIWKGGYPELWANPALDMDMFFEDYIQTYIERDLRNIIEINNLVDFQRFIRVCATRIGQLFNYRDMAKDVGVSDVTIKKWLAALEQSGIIYSLPPYHANIGKRFVKTKKLYFSDIGLACFLLNINSLNAWQNHIHKGNLWENLVFNEIIKTTQYQPGKNLFFYRDQNGVEIDFLIEESNHIKLIEAKSSERIDSKKFNFKKVMPLFKNISVECMVMANINEKLPIKMQTYSVLNPIFHAI